MENQKGKAITKDGILMYLKDNDGASSTVILQNYHLDLVTGFKLLREMETRRHVRFGEHMSSESYLLHIGSDGEKFLNNGGYETEFKLQEIEKYKVAALKAIKQIDGIKTSFHWSAISNIADIPFEYSDDIKNNLLHEKLMHLQETAKSMEDLYIGDPSISSYLLGIRKESHQVSHTTIDNSTKVEGNHNKVATIGGTITEESFNKNKADKEDNKINKKILFWTIAIVLLTAILVILALNHKG